MAEMLGGESRPSSWLSILCPCWLPWGFLLALVVKNPPVNSGNAIDAGLTPGLGRSPGEGNGYPLQCSCLKNPMDTGAWWATVPGVANSQTRLSAHTLMFSGTRHIPPLPPPLHLCSYSTLAWHCLHACFKSSFYVLL